MPLALFPGLVQLSFWDIMKNLKPVPLVVIALLVLFSLPPGRLCFEMGVVQKAQQDNRSFLRAFRKVVEPSSCRSGKRAVSTAPMVAVFDFGYGEVERQIKQRGAPGE